MSAFTEQQMETIKDTAELQVRRYFDHYLQNTFPEQVRTMILVHNESDAAHGSVVEKVQSVEKRVDKMTYILVGASLAGGAGLGAGIKTLLGMMS